MAVAVALLLGLAVVLATRLLMDHLRFRKLELAIPGLPSLPVLGNLLHAFSLTPDNLVATFYGRHDQLWRFGALGHLGVLVSDPDHLQELFTRKDLLDKDPFVYKFVDALGQGSINLNGAEWRAHRRALQPAFHQSVLDRYTAVFSDEAQGFVRRVRPGEAQDVDSNLQRMSARNFFRTTIAVEKESEKEVEQFLPDAELWLSTIFSSLGHRVLQPWLWPDWVFFYLTASGRTIRRLTAKVNAFCRKTVASRRAYLQQKRVDGACDDAPSSKHRTLVDILLEPGDRLSLSDEAILGEFKTFIGAAIDTTVTSLGWVFKTLSLRQGVQELILQEVEEVLGKDGASHITTEELARLEYTERVIKETLRLLPPVPVIVRGSKQQTGFGGHTMPAGAHLAALIFVTHRDPRHWPDPLRFDPDRFLPENSVGRHPYAYIPFSAGPRNCPGGRYAMMVMKTMLATLVPRYRIDPVDDGYKEPADLPMTVGITSCMVGGVRVVFTPRQSPDCAA